MPGEAGAEESSEGRVREMPAAEIGGGRWRATAMVAAPEAAVFAVEFAAASAPGLRRQPARKAPAS